MTRLIIASLAGLVVGLGAAEAAPPTPDERVAVVVDAAGAGGADRLAAGRAIAAREDAILRAPRTLHDQLSVTSLLAAQGYTRIVGVGLEERVAIAPLHGRVDYVSARSNTDSSR